MEIIFRAVPRLELPEVWASASTVLVPAIALWRGRHDEASIFSRLCTADMQLWIAEAGDRITTAAVTEIHDWPRLKECVVTLAAGEGFDLWSDWMEEIKSWAAGLGCSLVTVRGRKGWERILAPAGFRHDGIVLTVEL